ncbi:universal stress protein [Nocardia inohanensis]|uniref:universal stress protein n=1 Tax=Nocardia inohanensis TaxID=209246 RepID=UPI000831ECA6|nr:universal stress protein [Nocardia inohanensis]
MADQTAPVTGEHPVVAGVDGSEISYQAVAWAAAEAVLRHRPLRIVLAYGLPIGRETRTSLGAAEMAAMRAEAERVLTEAARVARHAASEPTLDITTEAIDDLVLPTLIERSKQAALMVVGNRGRGAIRRAVLGSVSTGLSRYAHCPVAVVHGDAEAGAGSKPIVVGVDGSANSLPAVRMAFEEASRREVPLIAVHAWSDSSGFDLEVVGWNTIRKTEDVLMAEGLAGFGEEFPDVKVERYVVCDTPVRALLEHAAGAQLLVVGTHGRSGFAGLVLGSVSTALLHDAECPVLVVRSRETAAE